MGKLETWLENALIGAPTTHMGMSMDLAALAIIHADNGLVDRRPKSLRYGRKIPGTRIGYQGRNRRGGTFDWDERMYYQAEINDDINAMFLGAVGKGKSALVKHLVDWGWRNFEYRHLILDPKREYWRLAQTVLDSKTFDWGKDRSLALNPLDPSMEGDGIKPHEFHWAIVEALALIAMKRDALMTTERTLLQEAVVIAKNDARGVATLPRVTELLLNPTEQLAEASDLRLSALLGENGIGVNLAHGMRRLTKGDLAGIVDRETTIGLLGATPLCVMVLRGLSLDAQAITSIVLNHLIGHELGKGYHRRQFDRVIRDESWKIVKVPGYLDSLQESFKLGRTDDVSNWLVGHSWASIAGSAESQVVEDLRRDTSTIFNFNQDPEALRSHAADFRLREDQVERILKLPRNHAMLTVGEDEVIEIEHDLPARLLPIIQTSHGILGVEDVDGDGNEYSE